MIILRLLLLLTNLHLKLLSTQGTGADKLLSTQRVKDLKILAFKKLVIQRILLLMFKHNIGIVPKPIASLFTKKSEIHNYNTRHCSSLHPAIGKSEATYRTFSYHAILIWNYLSKLICTNVTLACFKKRSLVYLQTHLISYRTVR